MRKIQLQDIQAGKYQGYLWYSDEKSPKVFNEDEITSIETKDNVFIVEGMLWQASSRTSIRITFVNGKQTVYVAEVPIDDLHGNGKATKEQYITHRMPGVSHLEFIRYWDLEPDPNCEGFDVLVPGALVFTGFKKNVHKGGNKI